MKKKRKKIISKCKAELLDGFLSTLSLHEEDKQSSQEVCRLLLKVVSSDFWYLCSCSIHLMHHTALLL